MWSPTALAFRSFERRMFGAERTLPGLEVMMLSSGPILVPLDGSPLSERSLPYATALARALDRKLVLMMAAYLSDIPEHGSWSEAMVEHPRETCLAYLNDVRGRLASPDAAVLVKVGYPHTMIPEAITETGAALVVLSTHGRSGFTRFQYGSTAGNLLHECDTPLLAIGANVPEPGSPGVAVRSILVPLDGSPLAEAALPTAAELAHALTANLTLVRTIPAAVEAFPYVAPATLSGAYEEEILGLAREYLDRKKAELPAGVDASIQVVVGHAAQALLDVVEQKNIDLVVMSTHARTGIARALLGSTADRMIQGRAPVLLLRPSAE
jgi:nucleotide-binding universal stress UspA family protein